MISVLGRSGEPHCAPQDVSATQDRNGSRADETELRQALPLHPQQRKESLHRKIFRLRANSGSHKLGNGSRFWASAAAVEPNAPILACIGADSEMATSRGGASQPLV